MDLGRKALKELFKTGKMLTEGDFSALIDGALNLQDDAEKIAPKEPAIVQVAAPVAVPTADDCLNRHKTFASLSLDESLDVNVRKPPSTEARLHSDCLIFGGRNAGKQIDSAQISAGMHMPDSLNIVGMSKDDNWSSRKVDVWAEGGMTIRTSKLHVGGTIVSNGINVAQEVPQHLETDGGLYRYQGQVYLTVDDHLFIRHQNAAVRFHFNTHNSRMGMGVTDLDKAQLSMGKWNEGPSGPAQDGGAQLLLSGQHNAGVNQGSQNGTYKLKIEGYNNDGQTVYPIYCEDENNKVDFWIKNRPSDNGLPSMYFDGFIQQRACAFLVQSTESQRGDIDQVHFASVSLNEGGYYLANERCFKAPLNGLYQFNMTAAMLSAESVRWVLLVNGENPGQETKTHPECFSSEMSGTSSSASYTVKLKQGDKVSIRQIGRGTTAEFRSRFSGAIISAMY